MVPSLEQRAKWARLHPLVSSFGYGVLWAVVMWPMCWVIGLDVAAPDFAALLAAGLFLVGPAVVLWLRHAPAPSREDLSDGFGTAGFDTSPPP